MVASQCQKKITCPELCSLGLCFRKHTRNSEISVGKFYPLPYLVPTSISLKCCPGCGTLGFLASQLGDRVVAAGHQAQPFMMLNLSQALYNMHITSLSLGTGALISNVHFKNMQSMPQQKDQGYSSVVGHLQKLGVMATAADNTENNKKL